MSFGDPNNPYGQQPPQGQPGHPQQAPQGVPPQYGYPQQPPQGAAPQYGYPQQAPPPYGAYPPPGMPAPGMPGSGMPPLAHWGLRVGAYLLDLLIIAGPMYALVGLAAALGGNESGQAIAGIFSILGFLYLIGMAFYQLYREGSTGQSFGKKIVGISLHREADGATIGFGMAFVRKLAHFLDGIACYIGYLWPLWDEKKQTFADKVCSTVVIKVNNNG
ncbi:MULTISPECIES: RDD family protein [unclassified Streptomyces]|uniref:RDD family protein n=1 Tax=unclassified Streptomyces TaxID=2593676 RepID=UPI0004C079EB|nr:MULTISPECIES: RDD family protein [unclassified Streptomyces]KOU14526.1 RDD domain containing protein [Streptomyces sp. WM6368]